MSKTLTATCRVRAAQESWPRPARTPGSTSAGFTLLEIMVVVVIIGILVTIVATRVMDKPDTARVASRQRGFTLLEILAVVVIIAITISIASLSLSGRAQDQRLVNEAERLQQLMLLAAEEANVRGEELGLLVANDGYRFYHLEQ